MLWHLFQGNIHLNTENNNPQIWSNSHTCREQHVTSILPNIMISKNMLTSLKPGDAYIRQ